MNECTKFHLSIHTYGFRDGSVTLGIWNSLMSTVVTDGQFTDLDQRTCTNEHYRKTYIPRNFSLAGYKNIDVVSIRHEMPRSFSMIYLNTRRLVGNDLDLTTSASCCITQNQPICIRCYTMSSSWEDWSTCNLWMSRSRTETCTVKLWT